MPLAGIVHLKSLHDTARNLSTIQHAGMEGAPHLGFSRRGIFRPQNFLFSVVCTDERWPIQARFASVGCSSLNRLPTSSTNLQAIENQRLENNRQDFAAE